MEDSFVKYNDEIEIFINIPPVAKSTQRPPTVRNKNVRNHIIFSSQRYSRLAKTLQYQDYVAFCARRQNKRFTADDPIMLSLTINKKGHEKGDLKNILAAIEDGLQRGGIIHNDRQVTCYNTMQINFYSETPGVIINLALDRRVCDFDWLVKWFSNNKKRAVEYQARVF